MAEEEMKVPEDMFKDVKFYPVGDLDPKVIQMLKAGKAKEVSYNALATHIIAEDGDNPEVGEAREVFDLPVVKPSWVILSVRCGARLPENGFSPESGQIFFGVTACLSQVSPEDRNSLWALTTFYGGDCQLNLNKKCTHLIVPEPKGNKYEYAFQRENIKIVTPDWVMDSVSEKTKKDEELYHPRLIVYEEEEEEEEEVENDESQNGSDEDKYSSKSSPVTSREGSPVRKTSPKRISSEKIKSELMFDDSSDSSPEKQERNLNWTPAEVPQMSTAKRQLHQGKDSGLINLCANVPPVPGSILPPEARNNLLTSLPGAPGLERQDMMAFHGPAVRTLRNITNSADIQQVNRPSNVAHILQTLSASTKSLEQQVNHPQQGHPNAMLFGQVKPLTSEAQHLIQQSHQPQQQQQQQQHHPLVQLQPQQLLQLQQQQQQQQITQQVFPQHQFPQVNQQHPFTQLQFSQQQLHPQQQLHRPQQQTLQHFQQQHVLQQQLHQLQQQHLQQKQQNMQQQNLQQQNLQQILQHQQSIQQTPSQQQALQPTIQQQQALQPNLQQQQTLQSNLQQQTLQPIIQQQQALQQQNIQQSIQQIQQQQQIQHLTLQQKQQIQQHSLQQQQMLQKQQLQSQSLQQQQMQTHVLQQQQIQTQALQQQQIQNQALQQPQQNQVQTHTLQQHHLQPQTLQQQQHHVQGQTVQQQTHQLQVQTLQQQQQHQIQTQNIQIQHQIPAANQHQIPPQMLQQQTLQLQQQMKQQQTLQQLQQQQIQQQQQQTLQQQQIQQTTHQQQMQPQIEQVALQQQQIQSGAPPQSSLQPQQVQQHKHNLHQVQQQLQQLQQQRMQRQMSLTQQMANQQPLQPHQLHGHDPSVDIPEDFFLLGCVFAIADYPEQMPDKQLLATWKRIIQTHGGTVDATLSSRCTHLLCESQVSSMYAQALKERKRCITAHWLNAVLKKKKMVPPYRALHFPVAFPPGGKPCSQHIISVTGFVDSDRDDLKLMAYLAGAKYTGYLCRSNTVLVCKEPSGLKYEKAKEWRIPCVNALWLCDILLGNLEALRQIQHSRYTVFNLQDPLAPSPHLVTNLLDAWRMPLKVSSELLMSIRVPLKPKQNEPAVQPKRPRIEDIPPPTKKLSPDLTPHVMFTGFDPLQVQQYIKKLYILGGEVADSAQKCTHLLANKVTRTVKFLTAISVAKHIVTPEWLDESFKSQKFIEEQNYILRDAEAEVLFCFSLEESLKRAHSTPLFKGKYFYITPGICPSLSTMKAIVECAGGKILMKQPSFRKIMEHKQNKRLAEIILISCENDLHLCREYFAGSIDVHNAEFVLTGVLTQTLDYESYPLRI